MRYQLTGDNQLENDALNAHPEVRTLFDPFLPVLQSRAIIAAARLGIFEAMGKNETCTAEGIARAVSLDDDAVRLLLRILVCAGYIAGDNGKYFLTDFARETLLSDSSMQLSSWVEFNYFHWKLIDRLEDLLQTGKGVDSLKYLKSKEDWAVQQRAMLETARPAAPWVAAAVPVRNGAEKMLDLGGSHGLYGAAICRVHPLLRSEVVDLPDAIEHARELSRMEGINDVVTHRAGDVLTFSFGNQKYDVVFLGNIIHHFNEAQNRDLLKRIKASLNSKGTVAIWDFRYPEPESAPDLVGDGFALLFRISSAARCYTQAEIESWLVEAGFGDVRIHEGPAATHSLVTGRK